MESNKDNFEKQWLKDFHPTWKIGDVFKKMKVSINRLIELDRYSIKYNREMDRLEKERGE